MHEWLQDPVTNHVISPTYSNGYPFAAICIYAHNVNQRKQVSLITTASSSKHVIALFQGEAKVGGVVHNPGVIDGGWSRLIMHLPWSPGQP